MSEFKIGDIVTVTASFTGEIVKGIVLSKPIGDSSGWAYLGTILVGIIGRDIINYNLVTGVLNSEQEYMSSKEFNKLKCIDFLLHVRLNDLYPETFKNSSLVKLPTKYK